jgi:hypothetical protein
MTSKADFTPDEWKQVLSAVMLSSMAVSAADPSGLLGLLKEGLVSGSAVMGAANDPNSNQLIQSVVADLKTSEGRSAAQEQIKGTLAGIKNPAEGQARAVDALKQTASILDAKAPAEAPVFKAWIQTIGQRTAEASSEGGFLGFGGVVVSDAEKAALQQIAAALNIART